MAAWWTIRFWRLHHTRLKQREHLALRLWPFLPLSQRTTDDAAPLKLLGRMVRAIERGDEQFGGDEDACRLWQQARMDNDLQQAAGALRTLRLQLDGNAAAAGLQVAAFDRAGRRALHQQMFRDNMQNDWQDWLNAPWLLPLLSMVFLFSGWLFNGMYLGRFGLDIGRYFGLSDYLAASIEGLVPAASSVIITFLMQGLMHNRTRLQALHLQLGLGWLNALLNLLMFSAMALFFWSTATEPALSRLSLVYTAVLVIPLLIIPLISGYFSKPSRDSLFATFLVIYGAVLWFSAEIRALKIERPSASRAVVTLASAPEQPRALRVLSGNSLYLFLLEDNRDVLVVPIEEVLSVRYPHEKLETSSKTAGSTEPVAEAKP